MLRKQLRKVEDIENFRVFIAAGVAHMSTADGLRGQLSEQETRRSTTVELSSTALEKTKTVLLEVEQLLQQLRTGLIDSDSTYSTMEDDYLPK